MMQRSNDPRSGPLEPRDQLEIDFNVQTHLCQHVSGGDKGSPHCRERKRCSERAVINKEETLAPRARERYVWPARTFGVVEGTKVIWEPVSVKLLSEFLANKWLRPATLQTPKDLARLAQQFDEYQTFISAVRYAVKNIAPDDGQVLTRKESMMLSNAIAENLQLHADVLWSNGEYMKILYNCETMEAFEEALWTTQLVLPLGAAAKYYTCLSSMKLSSDLHAAPHHATVWDLLTKLPRFIFDPVFNLILMIADWESCVKALECLLPSYRLEDEHWWKPNTLVISPVDGHALLMANGFNSELKRSADAEASQARMPEGPQPVTTSVPLNALAPRKQVSAGKPKRTKKRKRGIQRWKVKSKTGYGL